MKSMIWRKYNVKLYTNKGLNLSGANIALVNESVVWTPRWHAPLPLAPPVLLWLVMLQGSCTGQLSVWHHTMGNVFQGLTPQDLSSPILEMKEIRITPAHDTHHKIISSHLTTALLITLYTGHWWGHCGRGECDDKWVRSWLGIYQDTTASPGPGHTSLASLH